MSAFGGLFVAVVFVVVGFRCDAVGKVASQRPHSVLSQSIVLWSALQLAHGYLLVGAGGVVAGLTLRTTCGYGWLRRSSSRFCL